MTTTAAAIRDVMVALAGAVTPTIQASTPFLAHREGHDFRAWVETNPKTCARRFSIRYTGSIKPPAVDGVDIVERSDIFEVVIAYPADSARFGSPSMLGLDDVIAEDSRLIQSAIGPTGYHSTTAQACVIQDEDWTREEGQGVVFAVVRYRVAWYQTTGIAARLTITGTNGVALVAGDIVTGSAVRDVTIQNGRAKVTYAARTPDVQRGANMLQLLDSAGAYTNALDEAYGDWSYYAISVGVTADKITVIQADEEWVRIALEWTSFDISSYPGGGPYYYDDINSTANYAEGQSGANAKRHTVTRLTKTIAMNATDPGYFAGWQSDPYLGPAPRLLEASATLENETKFGERELGDGGGDVVIYASTGNSAYYPAWLNRAIWATQGLSGVNNKYFYPGISDTDQLSAAWVATQPSGFPTRATSGPYWMIGIHHTLPFVRFVATQHRSELAGWEISGYGGIVSHFNNRRHRANGVAYEHQCFIGGQYYVADSTAVAVTGYSGTVAYGNEPKAHITTWAANLAASLDWPT